MRSIHVCQIIILVFTLSLFSACNSPKTDLSDSEKELIETYQFTDWNGNTISIEDFKGSLVVLDFWETWCGPCLSSFPGFQRTLEEYPDDIVIIAATVGWQDSRVDAVEFRDEMDYDFIYVDGMELSEKLGFQSIPFKIIINREGNVEMVQRGSAGAEREYEKLVERIQKYSNQR